MDIVLNTSQLENMDLRLIGFNEPNGYTVVAAEIIEPDDHDEVWRSVVQYRDGHFFAVYFTYNKTGDEFPQHIFSAFSSRPPKHVFPHTIYR